MSSIPENLKYTRTHEWVKKLDDGFVLVGITDYAQSTLGDVVFVELPPLKKQFQQHEEFGVVESVKAASDLYSPLSGEIIAINESLSQKPELLNKSPYDEGWLIKIKPHNLKEWDMLLDAKGYLKSIE